MIWFPLSCRGFELIRVDTRGLRVASTSQKWQGGRFHLEHGYDPGAQRTSRHVRTSENHDAPIRPVCQMLNKYVSWLLKYVAWLSQLENYRLCVGKLRGHFLFMFFSLLSHFTYSAKTLFSSQLNRLYFNKKTTGWSVRTTSKATPPPLPDKTPHNKANKTWHRFWGDFLVGFSILKEKIYICQ